MKRKNKATLDREKWVQAHAARTYVFTFNGKRMHYCKWYDLRGWYSVIGPEAPTPVQAIINAMKQEATSR